MSLYRLKNWIRTRNILRGPIKGYYYLKYIRKYKRKEVHIPKRLYIETTSFCNAKCKMCPHGKMKRERGHMSWDLFKKIIDESKSFEGEGLEIILHKDGEPLLDPLLFQRIEYIRQNLHRPRIHFNSNAMLLNEDKARQVLSSGIHSITFSVDGASRETYEKIRVGLKYDIVKRNIEEFFELKRDNLNRIRVIMQMVVCEDNKHEIEEYKRLWSKKADVTYFKAMHNFLDMETSIKTKKFKERQLKFCEQPYNFMLIYWNGDVGLCCWDYDNLANLGNIRENSLINSYNNHKFRMIRGAMSAMDCAEISPCNRCTVIYGKDAYLCFGWERKFCSSGYP